MLDVLFLLGQAASLMLLIYGAFLVLMPAKKASPSPSRDEMRLLHLRTHA